MAEYIEREALIIENLEKYMTVMEVNTKEYGQQVVIAVDDLMYLPTADVVAVVRCKDCKSCDKFYPNKKIGEEPELEYFCEKEKRTTRPDDFCSYGERKDG